MRGKLFPIVFLFLLLVSLINSAIIVEALMGDAKWAIAPFYGTTKKSWSTDFWPSSMKIHDFYFISFPSFNTHYDLYCPIEGSSVYCPKGLPWYSGDGSWYKFHMGTFIYVKENYVKPILLKHDDDIFFVSYSCGFSLNEDVDCVRKTYITSNSVAINEIDLILEPGWNYVTIGFIQQEGPNYLFYNYEDPYTLFRIDPKIVAMNSNPSLIVPESCNDDVDNEGDGLIDCADNDASIGTTCGEGVGCGHYIYHQDYINRATCQGMVCVEIDCNDGEDNDGDSFVDMADKDCYNNADYDLDGFVTFDLSDSVLGTTSTNSNWNSSALNGSDGVCGDDTEISFEGDLGYVSQGGRYFCNKDWKNGLNILNAQNMFSWWDAANYENAYKIHNTQGIDFISNSAEWYYCAANNTAYPIPVLEGKTNALPISEGGTFSLPEGVSGYSCVEFLNAVELEGQIWSTCTNITYDNNDNPICDPSDTTQNYVCNPSQELNNGAILPITFQTPNFASFWQACKQACYIDTENSLETIGIDGVRTYFCDLFPFIDPLCSGIINTSNSNDALLEKSLCIGPGLTTNNCLDIVQGNVYESCEQTSVYVGDVRYTGKTCIQEPGYSSYCYIGSYLNTNEDDDSICCMVEEEELSEFGENVCGYLSENDLSQITCSLMGGSWLDLLDYSEAYTCLGTLYNKPDEGYCCVGADWDIDWSDNELENLFKPDLFVCYKHGDLKLISECCSDLSVCYNKYGTAQYFPAIADQYYYGKGGITHTVENFDEFSDNDDNEVLVDYIYRILVNHELSEINIYDYRVRTQFKDWSSFDFLEFDIAFSQKDSDLYLVIGDGTNTEEIKILDKLVTGNEAMRWHHAVVDLTSISGLNLTKITEMYVMTNSNKEYNVLLDSFILSGGDNSPNYYCTGNFGSWILNLDGETDEGFENESYFSDTYEPSDRTMVEGYGKYWYACEAQAAFDWTGRKCCGDDTVTQYKYGRTQGGEYYADIKQGCFHGVPIPSGKPVSYSFNDPALNSIMFYNGEFYSCNQDLSSKYNISYDGVNSLDALVSESKEEFDVIGDYICFEQNWINKNQVEVSKILLAKMYDLTFSKDDETQYDFEIMCDEPGDIATLDSNVQSLINSMCVLRLKVDDEIYTVTGLNFNAEANTDSTKTDAQYFMEKLIPDLEYSKEFTGEQKDSLKTACDYNLSDEKISAFSINPTKFFQTCSHDETSYRFAYNPSLNIMFIVDTEELGLPSGTNLQDLMSTGGFGEFIRGLWNSFLDLFTDWFGGGTSAGDGILDYAAYMPTFQEEFVKFDKVYLAKFSNTTHEKHIKALMETREDFSSESIIKPDMYFVSVEYQGFGTQVQKLAENYYNDNDYAMDYAYGSDGTQLISLVLKQKDLKKYSYQNDFDWKRLTSGLMVNPDFTGDWEYGDLSGNCQIDLGEECDTCNGSIIYNYNTYGVSSGLNCTQLDSSLIGNLSCTNFIVNTSMCEVLCGDFVCADKEFCFNEQCVECNTHQMCQEKYGDPTYSCNSSMMCQENECMLDEHCDSGTVSGGYIDTTKCVDGQCVEYECTNDEHCQYIYGNEYAVCNNYTNTCVDNECLRHTDCVGNPNGDYCDTESNGPFKCVECITDRQCNLDWQTGFSVIIGDDYLCANKTCFFKCINDTDCIEENFSKPICVPLLSEDPLLQNESICVECKNDFDCTSNELYGNAHKCNVTDNSCYFYCGSTDDCPADHPYCNLGECWQCHYNYHCEDNPNFGEGYECDGVTHECFLPD